jgi:hypothetical protein
MRTIASRIVEFMNYKQELAAKYNDNVEFELASNQRDYRELIVIKFYYGHYKWT